MMSGLLEVSVHLEFFNEVHTIYFERTALSCENDLECEELYNLFEEDIQQHRKVYFDTIFQLNDIYSERCAGILCSLASIFRCKEEWKACWRVLELTGSILQVYQRRCRPTSNTLLLDGSRSRRRPRIQRSQLQCLANLMYRYHDLCIDAHSRLGHRTAAIKALRAACQHELDQRYGFEQQKWLVVLFAIVGPDYQNTALDELSDDSLWQALLHRVEQQHHPSSSNNNNTSTNRSASSDLNSSSYAYEVDLKKCHGCNRMEASRGEFEDCSSCFSVVYCGMECQEQHWKTHKKECCNRIKGSCGKGKRLLGKGLASAKAFAKDHPELFECSLPALIGSRLHH